MPRRETVGRLLVILLALGLVAIALAPQLSTDRFEQPLRQYLEDTLQRPVQVGAVRFSLWGGPGFRIRNLVIADNPEVSAEPLAYVNEAHLQLSIASIWRRELLFSRITLQRPSLNLTRLPNGRWNYESVLRIPAIDPELNQPREQGAPDLPSPVRQLPSIVVERGRVNFRQGLFKSVYYFRNTDLRLAEEEIGTGDWLIEFRAEPARTDSVAPRFGTVRGRGRWRADPAPHGALDMDVALERSPLAELAALFGAPRVGLSGYVSALAHLSGPGNQLSVRGSVELPELAERSSFFFNRTNALGLSRSGLPFEGSLNLARRHLVLRTATGQPDPSPAAQLPYQAEFELDPARPDCPWSASLLFQDLPVETARDLLASFDDRISQYPELSGSLRGDIRYGCSDGLQGTMVGDFLPWQSPDTAGFGLHGLQLQLQQDSIEGSLLLQLPDEQVSADDLESAGEQTPLESPGSAQATMAAPIPPSGTPQPSKSPPSTVTKASRSQGSLPGARLDFQLQRNTGKATMRLTGRDLRAEHLEASLLLHPASGSLPSPLDSAGWQGDGSLTWQRASYRQNGGWSGQLRLNKLLLKLPGFLPETSLEAGLLRFQPNRWHLEAAKGTLAGVPVRTEIRFVAEQDRPYEATLDIDELDLGEASDLLFAAPPSQAGFLRRALSRTGTMPRETRTNQAGKAKIYARSVLINSDKYHRLKGEIFWGRDGLSIENISFRSRFGDFRGIVRGDFRDSQPHWRASFVGAQPDWATGKLAVELQRHAYGGLDSLWNEAAGFATVTWTGPSPPDGSKETVLRATIRWEESNPAPILCEQCVELRDNNGVWLGSCNQSNGTGYRCLLSDPRTSQQLELELPMSMVGSSAEEW